MNMKFNQEEIDALLEKEASKDKIRIENLRIGQMFKKKPDSKQIWVAEGYCRVNKKYCYRSFDDINDVRYASKGTVVITDFPF